MYQISEVTIQDLGMIKVRNQDKIKQVTGEVLDPKKAWNIIKNESENFTKANEKAKQADALFAKLMKANGMKVNKSDNEEEEVIRIKAKARKRVIELLELEPELAA